jgi:hypothetical protein
MNNLKNRFLAASACFGIDLLRIRTYLRFKIAVFTKNGYSRHGHPRLGVGL